MFEGLYFEYPKLFTLIFVFIACDAYCKLRPRAIYFPHLQRMEEETSALSSLLLILKWSALVMLVLAMMSPVRDKVLDLTPEVQRSFALVLDNSHSKADAGHLFTELKKSVEDFISKSENSAFGLITLNQKSYMASPLTPSKKALSMSLSGLAEEDGVARVDLALAQVDMLFSHVQEGKKIALFLVGHDIKVGTEIEKRLIKKIIAEGITCYTIILGDVNKETETLLEHLALSSGAKQYSGVKRDRLEDVLEEIDIKEGVDVFDYTFKEYFYIFPLFLSFFMFLVYIYLRNRRVT